MSDIIFALLNIQQKLTLKKHAFQSRAGQTKALPALPLMLTDIRPLPRGPPALPGITGSLLAHRALLWFIPVK